MGNINSEVSMMLLLLLLAALADALPLLSKYSAQFGSAVVAVDTTQRAQKRQRDAYTPNVVLMSGSSGYYRVSQPWFNSTWQLYRNGNTLPTSCYDLSGGVQLSPFALNEWIGTAEQHTNSDGTIDVYTNQTGYNWGYVDSSGSSLYSVTSPGLWVLTLNSTGDPMSLQVSQYQTYPAPSYSASYTFGAFSRNVSALYPSYDLATLLDTPLPTDCTKSSYRCLNSTFPSNKPYDDMVVYRAANMDQYIHDLAGENAATPLGVLYFYCNQRTHPYFTKFTVKVDTRFNVYGQCTGGSCRYYQGGRASNFNVCIDNFLGVGRERPLTDTLTDQCQPFPNNGTSEWWFSFPRLGECQDSHRFGHNACTWGNVRPGKTITSTCLFTNLSCSDTDDVKVSKFHQAFDSCPAQPINV